MHDPMSLFEREALVLRRLRAERSGFASFLHDTAADEVKERLAEINRPFTTAAVVAGFPAPWLAALAAPGRFLHAVADAERLDLAAESLDLVVHALALHLSNDPVGQLIQARRALRPDGLLLAVLFGGETLHELRSSLAEAEVAETGGLSPRVAPMADTRDLGALLQRAGLALPVVDSQRLTVSYPSLTALMHDLRAMGETNVLRDRLRVPTRRGVMARAEAIYAAEFGEGPGRIPATFDLLFLAGWAAAPNQQKPLAPGFRRAGFDLPPQEG